jgi:hypothetical protein
VGFVTPLTNFLAYYYLYFALYQFAMNDKALGSETSALNIVHSLTTIFVCAGLTCLLYFSGKRAKKKLKAEGLSCP